MPNNEYVLESLTIHDSWRLFKIISEVVEGFETLSHTRRCVSIFGSARVGADTQVYKDTETIARKSLRKPSAPGVEELKFGIESAFERRATLTLHELEGSTFGEQPPGWREPARHRRDRPEGRACRRAKAPRAAVRRRDRRAGARQNR